MHKKHMLLMLICCLIPAAMLAGYFLFNASISTLVLIGIFVACPVLHGIMFYTAMKNDPRSDRAELSGPIPFHSER